jgi:predicted TIM-barrel fold metal-dependent hydrolase
VGVNQIMWGSDYPHPEGTFPKTWEHYLDRFTGVPEQEVAAILGENAINFYGLDRAKLEAIAAKIGPRKENLAAAA